jgi:hypothetical protein
VLFTGLYCRELPVVVLTGPGMPMHVVVPSVSLAALLQGTDRTVYLLRGVARANVVREII